MPEPVGAVEQEGAALPGVERRDDPLDRDPLLGQQLGGLVLAGERLPVAPAGPGACAASAVSGATSASARAGVEP